MSLMMKSTGIELETLQLRFVRGESIFNFFGYFYNLYTFSIYNQNKFIQTDLRHIKSYTSLKKKKKG